MALIRVAEGATIDGFTVGKRLHQGGMGSLWTVTREGETEPLLMKCPVFNEGDDVSAIVGFEIEQAILPRVSGPHVPRFVAQGDFSRLPYIVMEQVEGKSLVAWTDIAPIPVEEVAYLGALVARALQELHRQKVLHLDLKPANVIIRKTGQAALLDFGLSRHEELPDLLAEESDVPMGTGAYIAPEQIVSDRNEPRSDIYSLGVILYELATGKLPFGSPQRRSGMVKRFWRDPVPPRKLRPDCPPWLQEIILRCLEIEPEDRFASGSQLAFALQHPDQVAITARGTRVAQDGFMTTFRRWARSQTLQKKLRPSVTQHVSSAPIVMAAVDLGHGIDALAETLRVHARRALDADPSARLACVTVLRTSLMSIDQDTDAKGNSTYVQRLVELKDWARPIAGTDERVSFHVLEAVDPAAALIEYAHHNQVDHMVLGARASSALRRYLGSVSAKVVAEAPCTVTVVRTHA